MFRAVLFDLDGTLLDIDMDLFIQRYFKEMIYMARESGLKTEGLIEKLWKATEAMIENKDPQLTNQQVFEQNFFKNSDHPPEVLQLFLMISMIRVLTNSRVCRSFSRDAFGYG